MNSNNVEEINLSDLGLLDDGEEELNLENLPGERSSLPREIPQPGTLVLRVPGNLQPTDFKPITEAGSGFQRLRVSFKEDLAFLIQPAGTPLSYNITDFRNTIKSGDNAGQTMGEFLSFLRALGVTSVSNKADMIRGVLGARGKDFKADLGYTATCNPKRNSWKSGKVSSDVGCGQKYDMKAQSYEKKDGTEVNIKQIPRDASGKWLGRFPCDCGADLQAFIKLSNYRAVK